MAVFTGHFLRPVTFHSSCISLSDSSQAIDSSSSQAVAGKIENSENSFSFFFLFLFSLSRIGLRFRFLVSSDGCGDVITGQSSLQFSI